MVYPVSGHPSSNLSTSKLWSQNISKCSPGRRQATDNQVEEEFGIHETCKCHDLFCRAWCRMTLPYILSGSNISSYWWETMENDQEKQKEPAYDFLARHSALVAICICHHLSLSLVSFHMSWLTLMKQVNKQREKRRKKYQNQPAHAMASDAEKASNRCKSRGPAKDST